MKRDKKETKKEKQNNGYIDGNSLYYEGPELRDPSGCTMEEIEKFLEEEKERMLKKSWPKEYEGV